MLATCTSTASSEPAVSDAADQDPSLGDDVTLAALHPLGGIKPAWTATFRGFHALAIDHAGRRNDVAPCYPANLLDQSKIDPTPNALVAPAVEIILNGRARRKVFRQRAPLAACRENVEDRVHHRAQIHRSRTSHSPWRRQQWSEQAPFGIRRVACITQAVTQILSPGDFSPRHVVAPS